MSSIAVAFAALAVIGVVTAQNIVNPVFRQQTISQGLNGRWHVALDGAFGLLAASLVWVAWGHWWLETTAIVSAIGLVGISVTNTAWRWVDSLVGRLGGHEPAHLAFTAVVFLGAAAFELAGEHGGLGWLSGANLLVPLAIWGLTRRQDLTEKAGVLLLCWWLFAWAVSP